MEQRSAGGGGAGDARGAGDAGESADEARRRGALAELRARLEDGRDKADLSMTQWARRAGLGRSTLYEALKAGEPPSGRVVAALAKSLALPVEPLLELRRRALTLPEVPPVREPPVRESPTDQPPVGDRSAGAPPAGVGRPIARCDPIDLEVHPSADPVGVRSPGSRGAAGSGALAGYVRREHDAVLERAVRAAATGTSAMVVLVGSSSTGKTRACWEAVQALAPHGWRLWHPYDPTRAEAALADIERVAPRTVVWLNEAQHYLGADTATGERVAAALRTLLSDPERGPVLVLATLWPDYAHAYTALPGPAASRPASQVGQLLEGRIVVVPDAFDQAALGAAADLAAAGDVQLARSLPLVSDGHLTQQLAGAPQLLHRYRAADPAAGALLRAAMDARRLGVGLHLPHSFLTEAVTDYLTEAEHDTLADDWAERAFGYLAAPVHGNLAPLRRVRPRPPRRTPGTPATVPVRPVAPAGPLHRLADYLEQHGRTERRALCPPESFWQAAHEHFTEAEDVYRLANAADERHRLRWAHHLTARAAVLGQRHALVKVADQREAAGDREEAERLYLRAAEQGHTQALRQLANKRESDLRRPYPFHPFSSGRSAPASASGRAPTSTPGGDFPAFRPRGPRTPGEDSHRAGYLRFPPDDGAFPWFRHGAHATRGDAAEEDVVRLYRLASDHGNPHSTHWLTQRQEEAGEREEAERLAVLTAEQGHSTALRWLADRREAAGERAEAERLALLADRDDHRPEGLMHLASVREKAGERDDAERLARLAARDGNPVVLGVIAGYRLDAGDREDAERLYRLAADHGDAHGFYKLVQLREEAGDHEEAERLALRSGGLGHLAERWEWAGYRDHAERLYRLAADRGAPWALVSAARLRERAGDDAEADRLYVLAASHGVARAMDRLSELREEAGDRAEAERFAVLAAGQRDYDALHRLVSNRERAGEDGEAVRLAVLAADHDDTRELRRLALRRERAGEHQEAERLALLEDGGRRTVGSGDTLNTLVVMREEAGAWEDAERLARLAADRGWTEGTTAWEWRRLNWPYGLDPDGTRTTPWE
ncbi:transcriptional regulator [Streptomyces sp. NBC_00536]|uniref:tetratricopeptide repeat protein n=1 Tax=Streptomyces sp. NBC_00536 TaxID=2975769 RepID=UPI002E80414B|nr:transcriptional regulator [Streptomyces sp. NBC_00536]WUC82720.1 transcriptional regulator [Streptomyces sp. NBC_00536]